MNADDWSARLTGDIVIPQAGIVRFNVAADDGIRLYIDDQAVIDSWSDCSCWRAGDFDNVDGAGSRHRIRIDFYEAGGAAQLKMYWSWFGQAAALFPGANLDARYDLTTTSTNADADQAHTEYANPETGLAAAVVTDPAGLALSTSLAYETGGLRRLVSRTLPAGNQYSYAYYGNAETRDNPCTGTVEAINQAGALKTRTSPDPDGAGAQTARVDESVYDPAGRVLASRINTGSWSCVTYDTRGRATQTTVPAFGGEPARTVTNAYAVGGNPFIDETSDPAGDLTSTIDLLGRTVSSTDVWGKTNTAAYDQAGRVTDTTGPGVGGNATVHTDYDSAGRVATVKLDGNPIAVPAYDAAGRLDSVSYPAGAGNAGNGTSLAPMPRDVLGRVSGLTWTDPGAGMITSDEVTRSLAGKVTDQAIDGTDADPANANFEYDVAGRLTVARVPGHTYTYDFAGTGGCGTLTTAGQNTNRTSMTDNGGTPVTYCYDNADRITATTTPDMGTIAYDAHNNITTLGAETLTYDGADRHMASTTNGSTVRYTRDATGAIVSRTVTNPTGSTADLGTVSVGSLVGTVEGGSTVGSDPLLEPIASADDGDYPYVTNNPASGTTGDWATKFELADMPADFASMTTLNVRLRYARQTGTQNNTWKLRAVIKKADGTSFLTDTVDVTSNITTTTPTNSAVIAFTGVSTTATKADWDGARLVIRWVVTRNGSGDTLHKKVFAAELTGTYSTAAGPSIQRYSNGLTLDANNNVIEHVLGLPGGATVTRRADTTQVWSYPNLHGDVVVTADASGLKQGSTLHYDPYGNALTGLPDNRADDLDTGWLGQNQIPIEHEDGFLPIIEMGARAYSPVLGRFLQDDPIDAGGCSAQDYVCGDPVNGRDLGGRCEFCTDWAVWLLLTQGTPKQMAVYIQSEQDYNRAHYGRTYSAYEQGLVEDAAEQQRQGQAQSRSIDERQTPPSSLEVADVNNKRAGGAAAWTLQDVGWCGIGAVAGAKIAWTNYKGPGAPGAVGVVAVVGCMMAVIWHRWVDTL